MNAPLHNPTQAPFDAVRCAALARALSDGLEHTVPALAGACEATVDEIVTAVRHLRSLGMRLEFDDDVVRAAAFVPLDARSLQDAVDRVHAEGGWTAGVATTTPSTNAQSLREIRQGAMSTPCILATDFQSDGRGRRGRSWRSVPGASLTVSFGLASDRGLAALEGVTLACGLAVRDVLAPTGVDVSLKWPNDVVVDDRKLAGILVESLRTTQTILVVGMGINVTPLHDDEDQPYRATDLMTCGLVSCDRHRLIADLAGALASRVRRVEHTGFASMAAEYNAIDAFLDRRVAISRSDGSTMRGIERGVDARGALCIETDDGPLTIVAGDVSLRLADA